MTMTKKLNAFAMIEVVMSTAIIGGLAVGAMTLVASAAQQKANAANFARGQVLCRSLAEEISTRPVVDWDAGGIDIEIDLGILSIGGDDAKGITITVGSGDRSSFETIDDYHGYTESPPEDEDGNVLPGYSGWSRKVRVQPVQVASPNSASAVETGLRLVEVTAIYNGKTVATTTFLRSSEWERVQP